MEIQNQSPIQKKFENHRVQAGRHQVNMVAERQMLNLKRLLD